MAAALTEQRFAPGLALRRIKFYGLGLVTIIMQIQSVRSGLFSRQTILRVGGSRVALMATACVLAASVAPVKQANAGPPTTVPYTYTTGTTVLSGGATNAVTSGGNLVDDSVVAVDYGQISNIFLSRFTPALVVCGIAGAILFASKGGVRMVHGWLAGVFH